MVTPRTKPRGALGDSPTRILSLILGSHHTIDSLAAATGLHRSTVYKHLLRLRDAGLIDWTEGKRSTIHATCEPQSMA